MSIYKKLVMSGVALLVLGGVGVTSFAATNPDVSNALNKVQTALSTKNYSDWQSASKELASKRVDSVSQDQFNKKADKYTQMKTTQDAITNGDYEAFKKSADTKMLAKINTVEKFNTLKTEMQAHKDYETKLSETIKNNDFEGYKTLINNRPVSGLDIGKRMGKNHLAPTDTEFKTRFDEMVAQYKLDGSLPSQNEGMMKMGGEMDMMGNGMMENHGGGRGMRGGR